MTYLTPLTRKKECRGKTCSTREPEESSGKDRETISGTNLSIEICPFS